MRRETTNLTANPTMSATNRRGLLLPLGQAAYALSQGANLILVARLVGSEAVGEYALALALTSPLFLFAQFRLRDVLATDPAVRQNLTRYANLGILGAVVALLASVGLGSVLYPASLGAIAGLAVGQVGQTLTFLHNGVLQGEGRFAALTVNIVLRSVAGTGALALGLVDGNLTTGLAALGAVWLLFGIADHHRLPIGDTERIPLHRLANHARLAWGLIPLGLATLLISLNQSVLRLIIESEVGLEELGVFACVAYVVRLGSIATSAINQLQSPGLRAHMAAMNGEGLRRLTLRASLAAGGAGVALTAVTVAAGSQALGWIFGPSLEPSRTLVLAVMLAGCCLYVGMPMTMSLIALGGHKEQLSVLGVTLAILVAATYALVPGHGIEGAAFAWVAGEASRTVGLAAVVTSLSRGLSSKGEG
jgi:O-antigen/teichoic acid export membrane protein